MMSARSPCRSERTATSTSSIDVGAAVLTVLTCWAAVHAIADTLKTHTPAPSRRMLRTGSSGCPGDRADAVPAGPGGNLVGSRANDRVCVRTGRLMAPHLHPLGDALHSVGLAWIAAQPFRVGFKITRSAALQGCPRGGCRPKGLRYMSPRAILKRTLKGCATSAIRFVAVVFGEGDYRTRTEDRPPPPALAAGDRLALGSLVATVDTLFDHPRLVSLHFDGGPSEMWAGLARHGRPIQYAHLAEPLAMWDVWTPIASVPVAFEPPSAGFVLDWAAL